MCPIKILPKFVELVLDVFYVICDNGVNIVIFGVW